MCLWSTACVKGKIARNRIFRLRNKGMSRSRGNWILLLLLEKLIFRVVLSFHMTCNPIPVSRFGTPLLTSTSLVSRKNLCSALSSSLLFLFLDWTPGGWVKNWLLFFLFSWSSVCVTRCVELFSAVSSFCAGSFSRFYSVVCLSLKLLQVTAATQLLVLFFLVQCCTLQ